MAAGLCLAHCQLSSQSRHTIPGRAVGGGPREFVSQPCSVADYNPAVLRIATLRCCGLSPLRSVSSSSERAATAGSDPGIASESSCAMPAAARGGQAEGLRVAGGGGACEGGFLENR